MTKRHFLRSSLLGSSTTNLVAAAPSEATPHAQARTKPSSFEATPERFVPHGLGAVHRRPVSFANRRRNK